MLVSGTMASVLSTLVASCLGRLQSGGVASATNATSHWLWDRRGPRKRVSLRHTAVGYGIHHACSLFWACFFEHAVRRTRRPARIATTAAATAAIAYVVDYHVVPRRLTPGFETRLSPGAMVATYAAFAVGLGAGALVCARFMRHRGAGSR